MTVFANVATPFKTVAVVKQDNAVCHGDLD